MQENAPKLIGKFLLLTRSFYYASLIIRISLLIIAKLLKSDDAKLKGLKHESAMPASCHKQIKPIDKWVGFYMAFC